MKALLQLAVLAEVDTPQTAQAMALAARSAAWHNLVTTVEARGGTPEDLDGTMWAFEPTISYPMDLQT